MNLVAPSILCVALVAGLVQARPDFSGKWTLIPAGTGERVDSFTVTQTGDTLTIDEPGRRWVHKLDGTESKNVTTEGNPPRQSVSVSTSKWEGDTLVTTYAIQAAEGPQTLRVAMSLEKDTLVIRATSTSQATGAAIREETRRYSR